jgi:FtsH-binding integral membrane protein
MSKSWIAFFRRMAIAIGLILAANLIVVAFWSPAWFTYWQVPISCTIFIGFLGITLYDTLFTDRPR